MTLKRVLKFEEIAAEVLARLKENRRPRTYKVAIAPIRDLVETFKNCKACEVLPDDFYLKHVPRMRAINPKHNLNTHKKFFVQILYTSYRRGLIPIPPIKIPKPNQETEIGRELSDDEIKRLLRACHNEEIKIQVETSLVTGMRLREILHLKWDYIDLVRGVISLPKTVDKNKKGRIFPIANFICQILAAREANSQSDFVFPMKSDLNRPINDNKFAWKRVKKAARVKCRFHDLRHTAATRKIRAKIPLTIVSKEMGMSEKVLKSIYLHLTVDDMRESAEAVHLPSIA